MTEKKTRSRQRKQMTNLQRIDSIRVALQRVKAFLRFRVPHLHHVIVRAWHYPPPVVADAPDSGHVAHQDVQAGAGVDVPHPERGVPGAAYHATRQT